MHSLKRQFFLLCLLFFIAALPAQAQQDDLYSVRVPVTDQSAGARYDALQEGLRRVLVKITGESTISAERLPRANRELEDYVSEYLYQPPLEPESHETGLDLIARFMPGSIDRLVRTLDLPVWPVNRPRILVWLVADTEDGPRFFSAAQIPELEHPLEESFHHRAVSMRQPLLDLEDQYTFPPEEAWALDAEALRNAAQRYSATTVLLLRLVPPQAVRTLLSQPDLGSEMIPISADSGGAAEAGVASGEILWGVKAEAGAEVNESVVAGTWRGDWLLLNDEQAFDQTIAAGELAVVVAAGINEAIDVLARLHAYRPSDGDGQVGVTMEVRDLLTFEDFHRAESMIRELEMVKNVRLVTLERDRAHFELELEGNQEILLQSLRNSGHFSSVSSAVAMPSPYDFETQPPSSPLPQPLLFSWVP